MDNIITLTIVLRKEVPDLPTAKNLYEAIKDKLTDWPAVKVSGQYNEKFVETE